MAKAPSRAAAARSRGQKQQSDTVIELTWRGRPLKLAMSQLGPGDDAATRVQTMRAFGESFPFQGFVSLMQHGAQVGTDIVLVVLWMARRKNGEPDLQLKAVLDDVGDNERFLADLQLAPPQAKTKTNGSGPLDVAEATVPEDDPPATS